MSLASLVIVPLKQPNTFKIEMSGVYIKQRLQKLAARLETLRGVEAQIEAEALELQIALELLSQEPTRARK